MQNTTENYGNNLGVSANSPVYPKSSTGLIVKIIIGALLVGSIALGIVLDTKIWDPAWNPFRENAEENVEKMIEKMMAVKTMHSDMTIEIEAIDESIGSLGESFKITAASKGDSDNTDIENPKSSGDFSLAIATEGMEFSLTGQGKTLNTNESYFKLDTLPMFPDIDTWFAMFGIDVNQVKGKWIKLGEKDSSQIGDVDELMELSKDFEEKIKEIIKEEKFYYVKQELDSERIGGQSMYHYVLSPNKESIKKIIFEYGKSLAMFADEMLDETEFNEDMNEFLEKIGDIDIEIWIGKSDDYLYRVKFRKEIDARTIEESAQGKLIIKLDMDMSNFNKPVTIEAPEDFIEFKDLFMPFYEDYLYQPQYIE